MKTGSCLVFNPTPKSNLIGFYRVEFLLGDLPRREALWIHPRYLFSLCHSFTDKFIVIFGFDTEDNIRHSRINKACMPPYECSLLSLWTRTAWGWIIYNRPINNNISPYCCGNISALLGILVRHVYRCLRSLSCVREQGD